MANIQLRPGFLRRFFSWFGRHKITAVFVVLVLAFAGWWFGSDIVWGMQVRAERGRYMDVKTLLDDIATDIPKTGAPRVQHEDYCDYTNPAGVFAPRFLGCSSDIEIIYTSLAEADSQSHRHALEDILKNRGINLKDNTPGQGEYTQIASTFIAKELKCGFSSNYYSADVPAYKRYEGVPTDIAAQLIHIGCSGEAKAEYFPVVDN